MFNKALNQMFSDVSWGDVDYCIVDMPPGTGDAQLSLAQLVTIRGAVVVTTPQEVALADVRKSVSMLKKVNVPVLGIVENMAGFKLPDGTLAEIFGVGGGAALAQALDVPLLASIPLDIGIRQGGDAGLPAAAQADSPQGACFRSIAETLIRRIDAMSAGESQLKVVN
jgi:ATP-binding protein involved in chromosome partitioning